MRVETRTWLPPSTPSVQGHHPLDISTTSYTYNSPHKHSQPRPHCIMASVPWPSPLLALKVVLQLPTTSCPPNMFACTQLEPLCTCTLANWYTPPTACICGARISHDLPVPQEGVARIHSLTAKSIHVREFVYYELLARL